MGRNAIKQQSILGWTLNLNCGKKKSIDKELTRLLQYTVFFLTCHALITWFELSRVKLYRNDLKGNKHYFESAGGSSYRG